MLCIPNSLAGHGPPSAPRPAPRESGVAADGQSCGGFVAACPRPSIRSRIERSLARLITCSGASPD